jgi:molecular chaperone GrpE
VANKEHPEDRSVHELEDDQVTLDSQPINNTDADNQAENQDEGIDSQVEALKAELAFAQEQVLRSAAEAQNIRRRAEQDVEKAHKFGLERFVNDVLPAVDNLERAIQAASVEEADVASLIEGVELTLKSLVDGLRRHKVEAVDPEGQPFDPQLHQAMSIIEQPEVEPNTVINVFQKGYTLHGRLVRPAMVVVSKNAQ